MTKLYIIEGLPSSGKALFLCFEGYLNCLEERQKRELEILWALPIKHIVIENAHEDRDTAYTKIRDFIL